MTEISKHIHEVTRTLEPACGPETPSQAVNRLLEYYQRLEDTDKYGFVSALIGEVVTLKAVAAHHQLKKPAN